MIQVDCHVEIEKKYSNRKDRFQWRPFRLFCFCEEQSEFEIRFCFQMVGIAFGHSEVVACPERVIRSPAVKNRFSIQREEESVIGGGVFGKNRSGGKGNHSEPHTFGVNQFAVNDFSCLTGNNIFQLEYAAVFDSFIHKSLLCRADFQKNTVCRRRN